MDGRTERGGEDGGSGDRKGEVGGQTAAEGASSGCDARGRNKSAELEAESTRGTEYGGFRNRKVEAMCTAADSSGSGRADTAEAEGTLITEDEDK